MPSNNGGKTKHHAAQVEWLRRFIYAAIPPASEESSELIPQKAMILTAVMLPSAHDRNWSRLP